MFAQRQTCLKKGVLSAVVALLLLATSGQSAETTMTDVPSNSSVTARPDDGVMAEPLALRSHRSCRSEHKDFCVNGGECMYPQDSDQPSCICKSSFKGPRCLLYNEVHPTVSRSFIPVEELIAISFGVAMVIFVLVLLIYCIACKKCRKSASLKKSQFSELSV